MNPSQVMRDYPARYGADETATLGSGMAEKSVEFRAAGAQLYRPE